MDFLMKKCNKCSLTKDLESFYKHKGMSDGFLNMCIACCIVASKLNYKKTDKKSLLKSKRSRFNSSLSSRRKQKDSRYKKMCGVGLEWLVEQNTKQKGLCAICQQAKSLVLDHCHSTKKPRGLLCRECNTAIGMLKDSPTAALSAASYLVTKGF
jgi:hypothetical protein